MVNAMHAVGAKPACAGSGPVPADQSIGIRVGTISGSCKILLDFLLAAGLLVLLSPLILAAMAIVRLTSSGPAIYSQKRLGLRGGPYTMYKIRTMAHDCERLSGPRWSSKGDSRVTSIGRVLRRLHIDELPQLWNVLRGEMSLVGPRPERPEFVAALERAIPHYRDRMLVRPGLTGLAQVQLPPDTDLASVRRKLACDLYYVRHAGPWLDLRILLTTATHLVGIPFAVPRALLQLPSSTAVEGAYRSLPAVSPEPSLPAVSPEIQVA